MPRWHRLWPWLLSLSGACTTTVEADVRRLLENERFPVTMGEAPPQTESVGIIAVRDTGFYPFGFIEVVPLSLQACVDEMVERAREMGGEGISLVVIEYEQPTSFLSFSVIFIPDWFGSVTLSGNVWRRVHAQRDAPPLSQ
jgi:hypothetical protein